MKGEYHWSLFAVVGISSFLFALWLDRTLKVDILTAIPASLSFLSIFAGLVSTEWFWRLGRKNDDSNQR